MYTVKLERKVFEFLNYSNSKVLFRLFECNQCRSDFDALVKQKSFELEEFKRLNFEFKVSFRISFFGYFLH